MAKFEVLKEEVIEHVTNQEIIEPSDSLISFLKEARKKYKGMKDIEILERFITGAI